uniref:Disease resistance protein At4g27190-like leucine-rich repeats domain-containing protein n=1 Tax=Salix viminalis TaxID=40686 RepID=A0A6N2LAR0_SALVM
MEEIIGGARSDEEGVMGEESSSSTKIKLSKLTKLYLKSLRELKRICSAEVICDSLKHVEVYRCDSMEILFPSSWSLVNLHWIVVEECDKMEEIIRGTNEIILPKLTFARFYKLPEMICNNMIYRGEGASEEESEEERSCHGEKERVTTSKFAKAPPWRDTEEMIEMVRQNDPFCDYVEKLDDVPEQVQDAARAAIDGPPEKKHIARRLD